MWRVAAILVAAGLLSACGDDGGGVQKAECSLYPDTCVAEDQCFPGALDPERTICLSKAPLGIGDTCDAASEDPHQWCGRELICVGYGEGGQDRRCSPLCTTDDDCRAHGLFDPCTMGPRTGLRFCAVR